jgi:mycothiol synthase
VSIELRPPVREDAAAIAAALNEFNRPAESVLDSPEEVEVWLGFPSLDAEHDMRVAVIDGRIIGYGEACDISGEGRTVIGDVRADPAHPDASVALLGFVEKRAQEQIRDGGKLKIWVPEKAEANRALLESREFAFHRYSLRMAIELDDEPPRPAWPDGISVRTYGGEKDDRPVWEVEQETFSDQRDWEPESFESWRHWAQREPFEPELWFLAEAGGKLVGVCLCRSEWGGDPDVGWVGVIGVRRPWRRKGLGAALMQHAFGELRVRGKKRVGLGVDSGNPTGAVRLYERVGMHVERRIAWYEKAPG